MGELLRGIAATVAILAVIAGVVYAITELEAWETVLDVLGIETETVPVAPASECRDINTGDFDALVVCADSDREFARDLVEACREDPESVPESFRVLSPDRTEVGVPACP